MNRPLLSLSAMIHHHLDGLTRPLEEGGYVIVPATGLVTGWHEIPPDQPALMGSDAWRYPLFSRGLLALGLLGRARTSHKEFEAHVHQDEE